MTVIYMTRLSSCDPFMNLDPAAHAKVIESSFSNALCLDWTREHKADNCTSQTNCKEPFQMYHVKVAWQPCRKQHHSQLPGSNQNYKNHVSVLVSQGGHSGLSSFSPAIIVRARDNVTGEKYNEAPNCEEIELRSADHAMTLMQHADMRSDTVKKALVFWNTGSNISMICQGFAEEAGLVGHSVLHHLMCSGGHFVN